MPLPLIFEILREPPTWVANNGWTILYATVAAVCLGLLKFFTDGRTNTAERPLHGRVVIITGGTSGIGASTAHGLAARGAQLVLLTQTPVSDPFLVDFIEDLRDRYNNQLIYAEQVDLTDLHSIRKFATKWIDNAPPRRLDMIVLCAATMTAPGGKRTETSEGIETTWMVNFLANFHLLGILSPAIRAQPFDRDLRIILTTCSSYIGSPSLKTPLEDASWSAGTAYARSKLALNVFGQAYQKHLDAYKRPDGLPMNAKVIFADPGLCRTPGFLRWITRGSLFGLLLYLSTYFVSWFLIKAPYRGAQSLLFAAMDSSLGRGQGGRLVKECQEVDFARQEVKDEDIAKKLWEESDALIERAEKELAKKRALQKAADAKKTATKEEQERTEEVESLMDAIKKGKKQEQEKKSGKGTAKGSKKKSKKKAEESSKS